MTARVGSTERTLRRLAGPLRRWVAAGGALATLGTVALLFGGSAWLARLGLVRSPLWVLLAWAGAIAVALGGLLWARWVGRRLAAHPLAEHLERTGAWRRGELGAVLDGAAPGTSGALADAADAVQVTALERKGFSTLAPLRHTLATRARIAAGLTLAGLVALLTAGPTRHPAAALWSPAQAWAILVAPVQLSADRTSVDRGARVTFRLRATGRREAVLWTRAKGESWSSAAVALDSAGLALRSVGPLQGDLYAYLTSGGRGSDTVLVRVRVQAFLGTLTLLAKYPAYLGLEDEPLPTGGDTLLLPAGTRLETRGEATARLSRAVWSGLGRPVPLSVEGTRFSGAFVPAQSGVLALALETEDGAPLGGDSVRVPLRLVPDLPPLVEVPVPGADTVAPLGFEVPLVADVRDDHGVTAVTLQSRRTPRTGGVGPVVSQPLELPAGASDRVFLSTRLDLKALGLEPGDTLRYWVVARDNSPAGQVGQSREFLLVLPTASEARAEQRESVDALAKRLDSLVAESGKLQRNTEDLSRERPRGAAPAERPDPTMSFDEAKKAEALAKNQQDLVQQAEETRKSLEELERSAERAGIADSAFQRRLEEVREQLDKALTPELKRRLEELRQALKNLDAPAAKEALKRLAEAQQQLKEALERSRELFRRAALEGELSSLEQEAKDVSKDQQQWNQQVQTADSAKAAVQENALAQRTDSLAQGLESAGKRLESEQRKDRLQQNAEQARQAAQSMRQAARSAKAGRSRAAQQQGEQAANQLNQIQKDVKQEREQQQDEWREEVLAALDRALAETTRLTQRQLAVASALGRGAQLPVNRAEQGAIEEGVQKLVEQIAAVSGKNALVGPQISVALTMAKLQMGRAREAVSAASANLREAADQAGEAVDALNAAAYLMLRSRNDVAGAQSGSGLAEAMERMTQLAQQQGGLSQEGNNLLSLAGQQAIQQQLQMLAQRQRALAQELERLRAQGQAPGAKDLADEAKELARKLESGRLDRETVDRQQRLFRRMLDAGRMLQGREEDEKKERQSQTAKGDSISIPPPLRARLLGRDGEIRLPTWDELQRLTPEERRLVTDYFRRLTAGGR